MAEDGLFVLFLNAFESFLFGVAGTGGFSFQGKAQECGGIAVIGDAFEDGAKAVGGLFKALGVPEGVGEIEMVIGIGGVAFKGPFEILDGGG